MPFLARTAFFYAAWVIYFCTLIHIRDMKSKEHF